MIRKHTTAFISGNFNTVHAGHVRLFMFAKKIASHLVVAVNSDEIGSGRVNQSIKDRKLSLEAVSLIDNVIILNDNVVQSLNEAAPDFIIKGAEHQARPNQELDYVKNNSNCKLIFSPGNAEDIYLNENSLQILLKKPNNYISRHNIRAKDLIDIVGNFKNKKVVILGDVIVDEYIDCSPLGMSREDPVIVTKQLSSKRFIGGAAIVASHANSLGAQVSLITSMGNDPEGTFVNNELSKQGISVLYSIDNLKPTTLKTRYRANRKTLFRVSRLEESYLNDVKQEELLQYLRNIIQDADLLIISDFNYGVLSDYLLKSVMDICSKSGVPVAADSQSSSQIGDISRYKDLLLITPTEREARLALRNNKDNITVIAELLRNLCKAQHVIITLGEYGMLINQDYDDFNWKTDQVPALNNAPIDVAGAGDSLLTVASLSLICGASAWQASYLGSIAAAIQVSRIGNIPIAFDELMAHLPD